MRDIDDMIDDLKQDNNDWSDVIEILEDYNDELDHDDYIRGRYERLIDELENLIILKNNGNNSELEELQTLFNDLKIIVDEYQSL